MDKVVQQAAANAEESASASEEMNAQAQEMKGFVSELSQMVGGSAAPVGGGNLRQSLSSLVDLPRIEHRTKGVRESGGSPAKGKRVLKKLIPKKRKTSDLTRLSLWIRTISRTFNNDAACAGRVSHPPFPSPPAVIHSGKRYRNYREGSYDRGEQTRWIL